MVTDGLFTDFDNDGAIDLIVALEFGPITFFRNQNGKLIRQPTELDSFSGWWNSLVGADFDFDGDIDYIAGNVGMNNGYKVTMEEPLEVFAKDFDNNGSVDAILACYLKVSLTNPEEKKLFPAHFWNELNSQSPRFRQQFNRFKEYGNTSMYELLSKKDLESALHLKAGWFQTSYIENLGGGKFSMKALPMEAQFGPTNGVVVDDVNEDGNPDVILIGNDFGNEVFFGRFDANTGLVLLGDGKGGFVAKKSNQSGFYVNGDAKALVKLAGPEQDLFIASRNRDSLAVFTSMRSGELIQPSSTEYAGDITLTDGRKGKMEFYHGSGYLSQSSRAIRKTNTISAITIAGGKEVN